MAPGADKKHVVPSLDVVVGKVRTGEDVAVIEGILRAVSILDQDDRISTSISTGGGFSGKSSDLLTVSK